MLPYSTLIPIRKGISTPVYLQICNSFITLIKDGILKKGTRLPGTRLLSSLLNVHRKTVIAAFEELQAQGWININPSSGAFVSEALPEVKLKVFKQQLSSLNPEKHTGFYIRKNEVLNTNVYVRTSLLEINDGLPDERLAPMDSLSRAIRSVLKGQRGKRHLSYDEIAGNRNLGRELAKHLNETRAFNIETENIFITRGTINALYLCCNALLEKGDNVVVGDPGYRSVNLIIENFGGNLIKVPVDNQGLCIETIEKICRKKKIRAIYVTPHHHYPTTVTMPPERRIALLQLAERHKIAIIEDDYDYDYHYRHSPFLPLASADPYGLVIYIGSFSKTFSPAFRVGYLVAPQNLITEVSKLRRIIDRQGDTVLEQALAELFKQGEIKAHLRRTQKEYHQRRDYFCKSLVEKFAEKIRFDIPEGGMAVWATFDPKYPLQGVSVKAASFGLYIGDGQHFNPKEITYNATRMGFAGLDANEIEKALSLLEKSLSG